MSKFKVSSKPNPGPAPASREQFAEGAAMVKAQTGGRPLKPIRVNFDMDLATHRRLKLRAIDRGLSVAQLVRQLIDVELNSA
jgi:hypothetical protein